MAEKTASDFKLIFTKEWVKQGRRFTSILSASEKYGRNEVFWKISGEGITAADFVSGKLEGSTFLKKKGSIKNSFELARNNSKTENSQITLTYFLDQRHKNKIAEESIELIAKSYNLADDPNEPWKLTASRIDDLKENVAVRAQITNGKPGKKVYFKLDGKGLDKDDLDLSYGRMTGQAKIDENGAATIPFLIRADNKTEGKESMTFTFYKDSKYKKKYSSFTLGILDESVETPEQGPTTSPIPEEPQQIWSGTTPKGTWFTIAPSRSEIRENNSTRTRINSNSQIGCIMYYKITGDGIDEDDFDLSYARLEGKITMNNSSTAFVPHLLRNDNKTEGTEQLIFSLYRDKRHTKLVASTKVPILDTSTETIGHPPTTSPAPSDEQPTWGGGVDKGSWFTLSPSRYSYSRGETLGIRIDSDSLPGAKLAWELSGPGLSTDDLVPSSDHQGFAGKEKIGLNGIGLIKVEFKEDHKTQADIPLTFNLYRDDPGKEKLASTTLILQATPAETRPSKDILEEGKGLNFKVFTKGVSEGKTIYWELDGVNITNDDFESPRSGSTVLDETRKFALNVETVKDQATEGTEYFQLHLYTDEEKTNLIGSSSDVTLFDTSTTPLQTYELQSSGLDVDEGKGFKIKVKTKNLQPDGLIYWRAGGDATDTGIVYLENSSQMDGVVPLDASGNSIFQFRTIKNIMLTDTAEFSFTLYDSPDYLEEPITRPITVTVMQHSTPAEAQPSKDILEEGKGLNFKVFTKGESKGQAIYWELHGANIANEDFESPRSGSVVLDETRKFALNVETIKDQATEGTEYFRLHLYTDAEKTNLIGSSSDVTLFDTSTNPLQTYELLSSAPAVDEGKGFKIKVKTRNLQPDGLIYWRAGGDATDNGIVHLENSSQMDGVVPLDASGNSIFQFRTIKNIMLTDTAEFAFTLYDSPSYLEEPIGGPITVTVIDPGPVSSLSQ